MTYWIKFAWMTDENVDESMTSVADCKEINDLHFSRYRV